MAAPVKLNLPWRWPSLAGAAWLVIAGISLSLLALAMPINRANIYFNWQFQQSYPAVAGFATRTAYATYVIGLDYAVALVCIGVAALIAWRRAGEPMAWLAAVLLVVAPVLFSLGAYTESWHYYPEPWRHIIPAVREGLTVLVGLSSLLAFIFVFPNGRFGPRWIAVLAGFSATLVILTTGWLVRDDRAFDVWFVTLLLALIAGACIQIYRYRRLSSALERQQTKWVVAGIVGLVGSGLGVIGLTAATEHSVYAAVALLAGRHLQLATLAFLPLSLAFSIFRYRLWDIDLLIRRTLIYSGLTAALAALYFGSVLALQSGFRALTQQGWAQANGLEQSQAVTVLSTLLIAALAGPLRARLQRWIDRRFYRQHYDAARIVAAFNATLRDNAYADIDRLNSQLRGVVQEALEPESVSLWLRP